MRDKSWWIKAVALWRLGPLNVLRVAIYRSGLRTGLHPVLRIHRKIGGVRFFQECQEVQSDLRPNGSWDTEMLLFGWYEVPLGEKAPAWNRNPFTGAEVQGVHEPWWRVPDFDNGAGDIKTVWEASRFDWVLAKAQRARCGEQAALHGLNEWVADWCRSNPTYYGPNWKCAQEASIRVMHLALAARLLGQERSSEPALLSLVEAHLARIQPTTNYAVAQDNNHATSEAAALFVGGHWCAHHGMALGRRYASKGRKLLEERVAHLVEPDGSFSQYSVNYHRLVLDTLSVVELWRRWFDEKPFSGDFYTKAERATRWLYAMIEENTGDAPNLGPNDGANLLPLTEVDYRDYRPAAQLALALFAHECAFTGDGAHRMHLKWLGLAEPDERAVITTPSHFTFGGYVVLASSPWWMVFRYPKYRFRPSHCDALHLDLWCNGVNLLRDGGSYSYNASGDWRHYFSGPAAHNTAHFDGRDSMPSIGRFLRGGWLKLERVDGPAIENGTQHVAASYRDWKSVRHHRAITLTENGVTVRDQVSGFRRNAVLRWRLAPGKWQVQEDGVQGEGYAIRVSADVPFERMSLVEGWESRYYMSKASIPVLEVEVSNAATVTTEIRLSEKNSRQ